MAKTKKKAAAEDELKLGPQPGPQTAFSKTKADIAIFGGAAGGGKSYALLLDPLRHWNNPRFTAVIFRRTTVQVFNPGSLWDTAGGIYPLLQGRPTRSPPTYYLPNGLRVRFAHLEHETNVLDWQGAQIGWIGYDELTHFSEYQFFYMMSRNRSDSGVVPKIRATCNPDADSWVAKFISWWINQETGYPIPERAGKLRWFIRRDGEIVWGDTKKELIQKYGKEQQPKSVTFIPSKLEDNKILMKNDPSYRANLMALPKVERERLLGGNWKIRATAGTVFQRPWFKVVKAAPNGGRIIRYWDRAATEKRDDNDPAWTAGLKLKRMANGDMYILHVVKGQWSEGTVQTNIKNTAAQDGSGVTVGIEQDPGQAGVVEAKMYVKLLPGHSVKLYPARKDKVTRAGPVSAQAEAGNIYLVEGAWNDAFLTEAENFPDGKNKDQVDALSGAYAVLVEGLAGDFTKEMAQTETQTTMAPPLNGDPQW